MSKVNRVLESFGYSPDKRLPENGADEYLYNLFFMAIERTQAKEKGNKDIFSVIDNISDEELNTIHESFFGGKPTNRGELENVRNYIIEAVKRYISEFKKQEITYYLHKGLTMEKIRDSFEGIGIREEDYILEPITSLSPSSLVITFLGKEVFDKVKRIDI